MKNFGTIVFALAFTAGPLTSGAVAQTELIFNSYLPAQNATHKAGVVDFAKRIEEQSGGSIKITIPDASLAPSHQQYNLLLDGTADMAFLPTDDMSQVVTFNGIADLPRNAPTARAAAVALWETYNKYFKQHGEYKGVVVLSTHALPGRQLMAINAPIDAANSLEGVKTWVPNGPLTTILEEGLGGVPIHTNFPQLFETVSKGLADALVITPGSALSGRVLDKIKHHTIVPGGLGSVSFAISIREESWKGLTDDQRAAILRAAEGMPAHTGAAIDAVEVAAQKKMGGQVTTITAPDALLARIDPVLDKLVNEWKEKAKAKGLENPDEVLAFYQSVLKREAASN